MIKTQIIEHCRNEVTLDFVRGAGPGGQNVNKVATSAQLRFDIRHSQWLDNDSKERLIGIAGSRATRQGVLVIEAGRYRTQLQNRADAIRRFEHLLDKALTKPKGRQQTRISAASKERRLATKRNRAQIKRMRRAVED